MNKPLQPTLPLLISAIMLILAIPPIWGLYGYYTLLRLVVCGSSIFAAYTAYELDKHVYVWIMGFIALLFNPIAPVKLTRDNWILIDLVVAPVFIISAFALRKKLASSKRTYHG